MATYWENSCSFGLRYVSWYKYLIVSLVFSHLGFWSGNLFLIAPFPDLCLLVPFDTLRSWLALMSYDPYLVVMRLSNDANWFSTMFPFLRNLFRYYFMHTMRGTAEIERCASTACVFTYGWANQILIARVAMSHDEGILTFKYEDIISQTQNVVKKLFECSGVDTRHVERAIAALSRDSQRGSGVSRTNLGDASHRYISEVTRVKCDAILTKFNLPPLGKDFRI